MLDVVHVSLMYTVKVVRKVFETAENPKKNPPPAGCLRRRLRRGPYPYLLKSTSTSGTLSEPDPTMPPEAKHSQSQSLRAMVRHSAVMDLGVSVSVSVETRRSD